MNNILKIISVILISAITAIGAVQFFGAGEGQTITKAPSVYDRVKSSGTIRCGYAVWNPILNKDPNTGELSGIFYDYMMALGDALDLEVTWPEESSYADYTQALKNDRYDAMCAGVWPMAARAREADFTVPIYYLPLYAYVRAGDTRFDDNYDNINKGKVTIAVVDGKMSSLIAETDFDRADTFSTPQMSTQETILLNVATGKADITFTDPKTAKLYQDNNPDQIRRVLGPPIRTFGNTIAVRPDAYEFRRMLDNATRALINSGAVDRILDKYTDQGDIIRVDRGYVEQDEYTK